MNPNLKTSLLSFCSKPTVLVLTVFLLGAAIFLPTLGYDFVWDDLVLIKNNPQITSLKNGPQIFLSDFHLNQFSSFYRPLVIFSFALDYAIYQGHAWGYHLTNSLIHGLNSSLVTYLALALFKNPYVALTAGAFFALHPVHSESVAFISGRTDLLTTLFSLLALLVLVIRPKKHEALGPPLFAPLFFFLALLSKETAVVTLIPMALALYQRFPEESKKIRGATLRIMPSLMVLLLFLTLRYLVLKTFFMKYELKLSYSPFFLFELFWRFLSPLILPLQQTTSSYYNPQHAYPLAGRFWLWVGLTFLLGLMVAYVIYRRRETMLPFALWFLPCLPPLFYNLHLDTIMIERYLYLPSAGVALLVGWGLNRVPVQGKKWASIGLALALMTYAGVTLWRTPLWKDEIVLFEAFKKEYPALPYARFALGNAYMKRNQFPEAYQELALAVKLEPQHPFYRDSLGWLYLRIGQPQSARQEFAEALNLSPNFATALGGMGVTYLQEGNYDSALKYLDLALLEDPNYQTALLYKNFVLYKLQQQK